MGSFQPHAGGSPVCSFEKRRNHFGNDTLCLEADFILQVVIPAPGLLLGSISVNYNFVVDSLLPE
jgi:hypothetical protein